MASKDQNDNIYENQMNNTSPDLHAVILVLNLLPDHVQYQSLFITQWQQYFITTLLLEARAQCMKIVFLKSALHSENALVSQTTSYIYIVYIEHHCTNRNAQKYVQ